VTKPNITTCEAAECLRILESADSPIVAADLAAELGLAGCRETQRRHVRAIIKHLRDVNGSMIVATNQGGYFLTTDAELYKGYLEGRQIDAKQILGKTHRQKRMLVNSRGQGMLFTERVSCGVASVAMA